MKTAKKEDRRFGKARFFILGILVVIGFLMISGAYGNSPGRYQLQAWGAGGIGFGAFVLDKISGETKMVYLNTGMKAAQANYLGVPFEDIKTGASLGKAD